MKKIEELYFQMLLIRKFEEKLYRLFDEGKLYGTTHGYIGQEANAVGIISNLRPNDTIFSNHRCHGHYIARTHDVKGLLAEIMGKSTGICGGLGGSQHICSDNFYTNGIQGSYMPIITGMAYAEKNNKTDNIVVGFIGDGTLGEGVVYESLNLMSLLQVPCLVIVENNQYAQSTKTKQTIAGSIINRFEAFNISTEEIASTNVVEIKEKSQKLIDQTRQKKRPHCLIIDTYRLCSHSKSDDFRDKNEIEEHRKADPLIISKKLISSKTLNELEKKVDFIIDDAIEEGNLATFSNYNLIADEIFRIY